MIEKMKQWLEALELAWAEEEISNKAHEIVVEAATTMKQAIAEAEKQEPHSWYGAEHDEWMTNKTRKEHEKLNSYTHKVGGFNLPLYTTPPAQSLGDEHLASQKPLTEYRIAKIAFETYGSALHPKDYEFARAIEAAHNIKE